MGTLARWLGERLPIDGEKIRTMTNEPVPNHMKRWWFALGGTPAYLFLVQIATGILLAFYYEPSPRTAYESVRYITDEAAFGWYLRSVHRWGATLMIAAVVLHQMRVFFTGAYRKPRDLNWMVGMTILLSTLLIGFTGYSLVYEQLSFWGATVGANIADNVPLVGPIMKRMILAGDAYNERTLSRFFVLHAAVLPGLLVLLIAIHIAIIRIQGISEMSFSDDNQEKRHFDFYPDHLYTELIMGLVEMIVLSALSTVFPATLGPRADPLTTPEGIKPEWFFYVAFRWLKLFSGTLAVLSMAFVVFIMYAWPWVDELLRRKLKFGEASVWIGIAGVFAIIGLTIWEAAVAH
jgi:quinol-cytochrome oxidoreductase complex cytochrome b subunit